jgi:hypothetical protein
VTFLLFFLPRFTGQTKSEFPSHFPLFYFTGLSSELTDVSPTPPHAQASPPGRTGEEKPETGKNSMYGLSGGLGSKALPLR